MEVNPRRTPPRGARSLREPTPEEGEMIKAHELKRAQAEELKRLQAEERQVQREVFRKCGHDFEDVTEERHGLLEGRELPDWIKHLIEAGDRKWANRPRDIWRFMKYEKCGGCGLVRVTSTA